MPFKPGQSGNPSGRPKVDAEVRELATKAAPGALKRLIELVNSADEKTAIAAANAVLDRACGKPAQAVTGVDGGPIEQIIRWAKSSDDAITDPSKR